MSDTMKGKSIAHVGALLSKDRDQVLLATDADGRVYKTDLKLTCIGTAMQADGSESMVMALGPCALTPDGRFVTMPKVMFRLVPNPEAGEDMRECRLEGIFIIHHPDNGEPASECRVGAASIGVPSVPLPVDLIREMQMKEAIQQAVDNEPARELPDLGPGVWPAELLGFPVDPERPKLLHYLEVADGRYIDQSELEKTEAQKVDSNPEWPCPITPTE